MPSINADEDISELAKQLWALGDRAFTNIATLAE